MKNKLNENIKKFRLECGYTQEELGNFIGVNKATVQRYEKGSITNIPADKIEKMAIFLKTTPSELMGWGQTERKNLKTVEDLDFSGINRIAAHYKGEEFSEESLNIIQDFIEYVRAKNNNNKKS